MTKECICLSFFSFLFGDLSVLLVSFWTCPNQKHFSWQREDEGTIRAESLFCSVIARTQTHMHMSLFFSCLSGVWLLLLSAQICTWAGLCWCLRSDTCRGACSRYFIPLFFHSIVCSAGSTVEPSLDICALFGISCSSSHLTPNQEQLFLLCLSDTWCPTLMPSCATCCQIIPPGLMLCNPVTGSNNSPMLSGAAKISRSDSNGLCACSWPHKLVSFVGAGWFSCWFCVFGTIAFSVYAVREGQGLTSSCRWP